MVQAILRRGAGDILRHRLHPGRGIAHHQRVSHALQHLQVVGAVADGIAVGQVLTQGLGHRQAAGGLGIPPHRQLQHVAPVDDLAHGGHLRQELLPEAVRRRQHAHLVKVEVRVSVGLSHPDAPGLQPGDGPPQLPVHDAVWGVAPDALRLLKVHIHPAPAADLQNFPAGLPVEAHMADDLPVQLDILAAGAHQSVKIHVHKLRVHGKPGPPGVDDAVVPRLAQPPHRRHGGGGNGAVQVHDGAVDVKENNAHIPVLSLCIFPFIVRQFPPKGNPHNAQMCRPGGREFFPGLQWPPLSATIKQNRQSIQGGASHDQAGNLRLSPGPGRGL